MKKEFYSCHASTGKLSYATSIMKKVLLYCILICGLVQIDVQAADVFSDGKKQVDLTSVYLLDGTQPMTADGNTGGNKWTNSATGTAPADLATVAQTENFANLTNITFHLAQFDPVPTNAVNQNIVRSGKFETASTFDEFDTHTSTNTVTFDFVTWSNATNANDDFTIVITGVVSAVTHSNRISLGIAIGVGEQFGWIYTNTPSGEGLWIDAKITTP